MKLTQQPNQDDHANVQGNCDQCNTLLFRFRGEGDIDCPGCGAIYNCFGQRLRDDLYTRPNPSDTDDDVGDVEGYELAMLRADAEYER